MDRAVRDNAREHNIINHRSKSNQPLLAYVWLALGSNLGARAQHLTHAIERLQAIVVLNQFSSLYETEPVGYLDQPYFLNMVCGGQTNLSPDDLLAYTKATETALGRQPTFRNGPRAIDIDILFYDALSMQQNDLVLPHPHMHERAFVLVPLAEVAPNIVHPLLGRTISSLAEDVSWAGIKKVGSLPAGPEDHT